MKKIVMLACLLLSGCFYQSVSNEDIERAEQFCKEKNSEVESIRAGTLGDETAFCKNREKGAI